MKNPRKKSKPVIRRAPSAKTKFAGFRRYGRRRVRCDVFVQDADGWEIPVESVDLSPTGMFVESNFFFEIGEKHTLIFRSPRGEAWFRIPARVVRVSEGAVDERVEPHEEFAPGMAYEFVKTDERTWNHLCSLVAGA